MNYCPLESHRDLVNSWNSYYPCPANVLRMGLVLEKPSHLITSSTALSHDFYYFGDEFSVIFHPVKEYGKTFLLVEGPHKDPTSGVRVPILSTWSHLRRLEHGESGIQEMFAFFENRWWTVSQATYNYSLKYSIDYSPYRDLSWCYCNMNSFFNFYLSSYPGHRIKINNKVHTKPATTHTLHEDKNENKLLTHLLEENNLNVIGDWFADNGDSFGEYVQESCGIKSIFKYNLNELKHKCEFIGMVKNKRSLKLLILAKLLINCYN